MSDYDHDPIARQYARRKCADLARWLADNPVVNLPQPLMVKPATPPTSPLTPKG